MLPLLALLLPSAVLASPSHLVPLSSSLPSCAIVHPHLPIALLPPSCTPDASISSLAVPFEEGEGDLYWFQTSVLDPTVFPPHLLQQEQQQHFAALPLLPLSSGHAIHHLSSPPSHAPDNTEVVKISFYPPPSPVPSKDVARIQAHLDRLKFEPLVSTLLSAVGNKGIREIVRTLSGEDQSALKEGEGWRSRHSMSTGGHKASNWLLSELEEIGLNCSQHSYLPHFAPLVACEIQGRNSSAGTVVVGAHFDSRGSFGFPTAPGADDDGSGTALLLTIARHITKYRLTFERKVIISFFSGEEQGLLGSNWFAKHLREKDEDVVLMIQADMVGYRKPGEPMQIAFPPDTLGLQEARYLLGNISTLYVPELVVGQTPACCSDHQSFSALGMAATWVFERNGPIADPFYHNSGDLSEREGYDYDQIQATTRVVLGALLEVGGYAFV